PPTSHRRPAMAPSRQRGRRMIRHRTHCPQWAPVTRDPRYTVSDTGLVHSIRGALKPTPDSQGYPTVRIGPRHVRIHTLVLEAFIGPRPSRMVTRHLNGIPSDNRLENLVYGTHQENCYDQVTHGTHPWSTKTHCPQGHPYSRANTKICRRGDGR